MRHPFHRSGYGLADRGPLENEAVWKGLWLKHPSRPGAAVNEAWCYWTETLSGVGQFESAYGWKIRFDRESWVNGARSVLQQVLRQVTRGWSSGKKRDLLAREASEFGTELEKRGNRFSKQWH